MGFDERYWGDFGEATRRGGGRRISRWAEGEMRGRSKRYGEFFNNDVDCVQDVYETRETVTPNTVPLSRLMDDGNGLQIACTAIFGEVVDFGIKTGSTLQINLRSNEDWNVAIACDSQGLTEEMLRSSIVSLTLAEEVNQDRLKILLMDFEKSGKDVFWDIKRRSLCGVAEDISRADVALERLLIRAKRSRDQEKDVDFVVVANSLNHADTRVIEVMNSLFDANEGINGTKIHVIAGVERASGVWPTIDFGDFLGRNFTSVVNEGDNGQVSCLVIRTGQRICFVPACADRESIVRLMRLGGRVSYKP